MAGYKFLILRVSYHNKRHLAMMLHFLNDGEIICL